MTARTHVLALDPGVAFVVAPGEGAAVWTFRERAGVGFARSPRGEWMPLRAFILKYGVFVYPIDPAYRPAPRRTDR